MQQKGGKSALGIVRKYYPNVNRVTDAKQDAEVTVTPQDAKRSRSKDPSGCAMAQAFKRTYDGAIVSNTVAYLVQGNQAVRYTVPHSVRMELVSFDRHHDFAPGNYYLKAVPKTDRMGPRRYEQLDNRHDTKYPQVKKRRQYHKTEGIRSL